MTLKFPIYINWEFLKGMSLLYLAALLIGILIVIFFLKSFLSSFVKSYLTKKRRQKLKSILKQKYLSNIKNLRWENKLQKALLFLELLNEVKLSPETTTQLQHFWESQKISTEALDEIITKLEILLLTKH